MGSDTIADAHEYKQVQLLAALASLHTITGRAQCMLLSYMLVEEPLVPFRTS